MIILHCAHENILQRVPRSFKPSEPQTLIGSRGEDRLNIKVSGQFHPESAVATLFELLPAVRHAEGADVEIDEEMREWLRSLGYIR